MCNEASKVAEELLGRLSKLTIDTNSKGKRRVWASLSQAVNSAWSSSEIAALASRLQNLKALLQFGLMVDMRNNVDILSLKISKGFEDLDRQTQYIVSALTHADRLRVDHATTEYIATLMKLLARLEINNSLEHRKTRVSIAAAGGFREITSNAEILEVPHEKESIIRKTVCNGILQDLNFQTRTHRFEELAEAHQKTFEWVFDESERVQKWSNFARWLREGDGVYWIQGKAGAGKSTLMGFMHEDPRTQHLFASWASHSLPLYIGSFFFWLSGNREQRSQQGLLRSLLFEILNQEPDLVPIVLPLLWAERYSLEIAGRPGVGNHAWTLKALKGAFRLLISQDIVPMKLCLFIDGLDEFDGDHEEISELFKGITSSNVKVCLSSRPWVVFEECFEGLPSLRLQDLTRPDIELYTDQLLLGNVYFRNLALIHPLETSSFVQEIVDRADGVFLWVTLVVRSLLNGIKNRDSIEDMQLRLRRLPKELESLYSHLLSLIEPEYLPWASRAFQILIKAQQVPVRPTVFFSGDTGHEAFHPSNGDLSVLQLVLAMDETLKFATLQGWKTLSEILNKCDTAKVHLTARCAGLLELWGVHGSDLSRAQVQFLHRTARDYLLTPSVWENLIAITPKITFNPDVSLLRACVFRAYLCKRFAEDRHDRMSFRGILFAKAAEDALLKAPPETLDNIELEFERLDTPTGTTLEPGTAILIARHGLPPAETFLPIAAMFGLTSYLQRRPIGDIKRLVGDGASLLHYAIPRDLNDPRFVLIPTAQTVKLLTTCDLNLDYNGRTPWQQALALLSLQQEIGRPCTGLASVLKIITYMLQAGADPQVKIRGRYGYTLQDLFHDMRVVPLVTTTSDELRENMAELEVEVEKAFKALKDVPLDVIPVEFTTRERSEEVKKPKMRWFKAWSRK